MAEDRLYIKVILPNQAQEGKKPGGGKTLPPLKPVTSELRSGFIEQINRIEHYFEELPATVKAIPAKVKLEKNALAKSHRPTTLFNQDTWSIIGVGEPGELFVRVSADKSEKLRQKIESGFSPQVERAISTIQEIAPVDSADRLSGLDSKDVFESAPERNGRKLIKVKLFSFSDPDEQDASVEAFEDVLERENIPFTKQENYINQVIYQVECDQPEQVEKLAKTVMVRSVARLPIFKMLRFNKFNQRPIPQSLSLPLPDPESYPIVAVVDSGVTNRIENLEKWIYKRETFVAGTEQNTYHGTFVAGLVVWGHELNSSLGEVDPSPCRILDIHILPNIDPFHGSVGTITEVEFLQDLESCLLQHANHVKVWNLSLGSDEVCALDKFSDFAMQLDNLQEKYNVTFVIAAGNFEESSLLSYPRDKNELERGRITAPADSVLGITVGSISQTTHPNSGTFHGEPSPFSRNGPGPNHIIKPDFVHYGGNIGKDYQEMLGITSLSDETNIGDNIGTSFSAPLISRKLAYIYDRVTPMPSPTMARALLTHNARDIRTRSRVVDEDNYCLGFGTPIDIDLSLRCQNWYSTLVFEETLRPGYELEWDFFPYPESLRSKGGFRGEIWMTLAYPPLRNPNYGSEYCETHVEAHFGLIRNKINKKTGLWEEKFSGEVPAEHQKSKELFEFAQVEKFRKWSPVRTYYKRIPKGVSGERWKLKVSMLTRHDFERNENQLNLPTMAYLQPFALILTIADPDRKAPIYDEMARMLRSRLQSQNLQVRPSVRIRPSA